MDSRETSPVILIATASAEMRERLGEALHDSAANEATDAAELRRRMRDEEPDLLVLDQALPGLGGVSALPALRRLSPGTRVLLLVAVPSDRDAVAAFKAGVRGYARRDLAEPLLRKAVAAMLAGEIWAARRVVGRLLDELTAQALLAVSNGNRSRADLGALTAREREIALLVGSGASNKEIATAAGVTERTVKAHLTAIFRKLGVPDRLRLALLVSDSDEAGNVVARTATVRRSNLRQRARTE